MAQPAPQPQPQPQGSQSSSAPSSSSSVLVIPQTAAAGGLTMTQPPQTVTSFYKIAPSQLVTFGWNMTSVIATPTHLTVSAFCSNGNAYPVGPTDGVIPGTATQVVWDIFSYQQNNPTPLGRGACSLSIWDDRGRNAQRKGGFMSPFGALQFALYTPEPYTAIASGWTCTTCNGGMSLAANPAFVGVLATLIVMFLSGFHLLRTGRAA